MTENIGHHGHEDHPDEHPYRQAPVTPSMERPLVETP